LQSFVDLGFIDVETTRCPAALAHVALLGSKHVAVIARRVYAPKAYLSCHLQLLLLKHGALVILDAHKVIFGRCKSSTNGWVALRVDIFIKRALAKFVGENLPWLTFVLFRGVALLLAGLTCKRFNLNFLSGSSNTSVSQQRRPVLLQALQTAHLASFVLRTRLGSRCFKAGSIIDICSLARLTFGSLRFLLLKHLVWTLGRNLLLRYFRCLLLVKTWQPHRHFVLVNRLSCWLKPLS